MNLKTTLFIFSLLFFCQIQFIFAQSKKEQIEVLNGRLDSLNRILESERGVSNQKLQEYENEIRDLKSQLSKIQLGLTKTTKELNTLKIANDSLISLTDSIKNFTNHDEYLRKLIVDKYLKNKTFGIKYYSSYDGVGPDGGSFTTIIDQNGKFYIEDIGNGGPPNGTQEIEIVQNDRLAFFTSWKFAIDEKLNFVYTDGDQLVSGKVSYLPAEGSEYFSDSTYLSSIISLENSIKIPIGVISLETIRGNWKFHVYFLVGKEEFSFPLVSNSKKYSAFNPIVLESRHVRIIMTEID